MIQVNITEEDLSKLVKRAKSDLLRLNRDKMHQRLGLSTALPEMCALLCSLLTEVEVSEEVDEVEEEDELGGLEELDGEEEEEEEEVVEVEVEVSEDTEGES